VTSKVLPAARMELHVASWGQSSPNHNMRSAAKLVVGDERLALGLAKPPFAEMLAVVSNCLPSLYRYAYRQLGNKTDAEDAVQDALLAAYKHLNQFRGDSQFSTWLTTIVINCARMHLRKRSRYVHVSLDSRTGEDGEHPLSDLLVDHRPNPEDECHRSTLNARLMKAAAQLSPTLRKTFHLRFVDHLSVSETARVLGVPTGTVKAQTARARAKLLKAMRGLLRLGPAERNSRSPGRPQKNNPVVPATKSQASSL
jgi:RNA polymerase sigma-70 factor, ECF subfamily